jgi:hypothetical protein
METKSCRFQMTESDLCSRILEKQDECSMSNVVINQNLCLVIIAKDEVKLTHELEILL